MWPGLSCMSKPGQSGQLSEAVSKIKKQGPRNMAQRVKAFSTKRDGLCSVLRVHRVERDGSYKLFSDLQVLLP